MSNNKKFRAGLGRLESLFHDEIVQTDLESGRWEVFPTQTTLPRTDYTTPLEWRIKSSKEHMIDTSPWYLHMNVQILNRDNTELKAQQWVAPICHFLMTQFVNAELFLNNRMITLPQNTFAWTSYITALTQFSQEAKNSILSSSLFYTDAYMQFDSTDVDLPEFEIVELQVSLS